MKKQPYNNEEIDNLYRTDEIECSVCGAKDDLTVDEDGNDICTDCLFEKEIDLI